MLGQGEIPLKPLFDRKRTVAVDIYEKIPLDGCTAYIKGKLSILHHDNLLL